MFITLYPQIDILNLYLWATGLERSFWLLLCKAKFLKEERKLAIFLYALVYNDNDFYSIPSTLMFLSFTSELQEDLVAKLLSREEGRYLATFCRGVVSTGA